MARWHVSLLLAGVALATGLSIWLLQDPPRPILAAVESAAELAPGPGLGSGAAQEPEAILQLAQSAAARQTPTGALLGTPKTPERDPERAADGRVAGWLHPVDDRPWRDAWVALFARDSDGPPTLIEQHACDPNGGFQIASSRAQKLYFVALARGFQPCIREVELARGAEVLFEDLELQRGVSISGSVSSNGKPLPRFEIVAVAERDTAPIVLVAGELVWNGSDFDWRYTTGESGEDGKYAVTGLREGSYRVRISTCRGPMASLCTNDRDARRIRAPESGIDFNFESSTLNLRCTRQGVPLEGVDIELSSGSWRSGRRCDDQGECTFLLVPRLECDLVATKKGYETLRLPVTAPLSGAAATQSLELKEKEPARSLRFLVSVPRDEALSTLRVWLYDAVPAPDRGDGGPPRARLYQQLSCTRETYSAAVREYVLEDPPAGAFRIVVNTGDALNAGTQVEDYIGTFCPAVRNLTIPASGEQRIELALDRRAALRLDLRGRTGVYPTARCTLRSAGGQELPIVLFDPRAGAPLVGHDLALDGPTLVFSTLCSGSALLTVDQDGRTLLQQTVNFLPGVISTLTLPQ